MMLAALTQEVFDSLYEFARMQMEQLGVLDELKVTRERMAEIEKER
jgi:hypothetical protein